MKKVPSKNNFKDYICEKQTQPKWQSKTTSTNKTDLMPSNNKWIMLKHPDSNILPNISNQKSAYTFHSNDFHSLKESSFCNFKFNCKRFQEERAACKKAILPKSLEDSW